MCHRHSACQLLLSCHNFSAGAAGHQKKEMDLTACQVALQNGEQQLHAEKAELAALVETLKVCTADQHLYIIFSFQPFVPFLCLLCSFRITVIQLRLPSCLSGLSSWLSSACMTSCHCMSFLIVAALVAQQNRNTA